MKLIRQYVPDAAITTDIIVGFPGETEEDFAETMDVVAKVGFTSAFTFIYSKRSGTPAAKMDNQVPLPVKKERLNRLRALSKDSLSLTLISAISLFPPHAQRPESQQNLPADAVFAVRPKFFRFCGKTGRYLPLFSRK